MEEYKVSFSYGIATIREGRAGFARVLSVHREIVATVPFVPSTARGSTNRLHIRRPS
jgi:hypothetical protein